MYDYLRRGALAGAVGGGAYGLYVALVGNPLVAHAEQLAHRGHDHAHRHEAAGGVVSEGVTQAVSVGSGVALGVLFGLVVFGVAAYLLEPALPDRGGSYLLGAAGFLTVSGVPWLVLPPAAPGVEPAVATDAALALYAGLMAVGAAGCLAAGWTYRRLSNRGAPVAAGAGLAALAGTVGLAVLVAPSPAYESALPATFEAAYVGAVVVGQLGLWGVTAAAHDRLGASPAGSAPTVEPTPAD
jgi:hypothetical protein